MKLFFALAFLLPVLGFAQNDTSFTLSIGGSGDEMGGQTMLNNVGGYRAKVAASTDGSIYLVSYSASNDGFMHSNAGLDDMLLVKLSENGDTLWTRTYGGSEYDRAFNVLALGDSGCVVVGYSISTDGIFSANHAASYADGVVIRVDEDGNTVWLKMFGGESLDYLYDIILTSDGALMACGETASNTGDLNGTGSGLNWVIKMNIADGAKIWSKTYEGPFAASVDMLENVTEITELSGGNGIIISGFGTPNFNDFNQDDIIYAKIDLNGNLQWFKSIGSTTGGDYSAAIIDGGSGQFYIVGRLQGTGSNVANYYGGGGDMWLIKFDASGNKVWDRNYGGTDYDFALDAVADSSGYIYMVGFTRSANNEASFNAHGMMDFWLVKVNPSGDTIYTSRHGGSAIDVATGVCLVGNNVFMAGRCESSDGDVHDHFGGRDIWLIRIDSVGDITTHISQYNESNIFMLSNPTPDGVLQIGGNTDIVQSVEIYDYFGRLMRSYQFQGTKIATGLSSGNYLVVLKCNYRTNTVLRWIVE